MSIVYKVDPTAGVQPWQDPGDTLRMNGVGERKKTSETNLDRAKSVREGERERERERERHRETGVCRVWQSLAMLYFLPWLLYSKLVHF